MATESALLDKIDEQIAALRRTIKYSQNLINQSKRLIQANLLWVAKHPFAGKDMPSRY